MYDEMETMNGVCPYCGQILMVKAMDQRDADLKAADKCDCSGAVVARAKAKALDKLESLIGDDAVNEGYKMLTFEQQEFARMALAAVCEGLAAKIAVNMGDSVFKVGLSGEDNIKLSRTRKVQREFKV